MIQVKAIVTEIEVTYCEQKQKKALLASGNGTFSTSRKGSGSGSGIKSSSGFGGNSYQFDFSFKDYDLIRDTNKLIMYCCDQGGFTSDSDRVEDFLKGFLSQVLFLNSKESGVDDEDDLAGSEEEENDDFSIRNPIPGSVANTGMDSDMDSEDDDDLRSSGKRGGGKRSLRKEALKRSALDKVTKAKLEDSMDFDVGIGGSTATALSSVHPTIDSNLNDLGESMEVHLGEDEKNGGTPIRPTYVFYGNNSFYAFFRLYQVRGV